MKVVTLVKGKVQSTKKEAFEAGYRSLRGDILPPGLETSFLLRGTDDPEMYIVETIWSSREALQAMRSSERPKAVVLFEQAGVSPKVEIHEVVDTVPPEDR